MLSGLAAIGPDKSIVKPVKSCSNQGTGEVEGETDAILPRSEEAECPVTTGTFA